MTTPITTAIDTPKSAQPMPAAASYQTRYANTVWRRSILLVALLVIAVLAFVADLIVGSGTLTFGEAISGLLQPDSVDASTRVILWELRMPMTLMAVLAGTCLALAGLMMQTVLDNPLAEPFTLGISSAAGFGASLFPWVMPCRASVPTCWSPAMPSCFHC